MTHVVELPVAYLVEGAVRGKRKPLVHRVVELVPFAIEDLEPTDEIVEIGRYRPMIAEGRPWIPVTHLEPEGMTLPELTVFGARFARSRGFASDSDPLSLLGRQWRDVGCEQVVIDVPHGADWRDSFGGIAKTDRADSVAVSQALATRLRVVEGRLHTDRYEPLLRSTRGLHNEIDDIDGGGEYVSFFDLVTQAPCVARSERSGGLHGVPLRIAPYARHSIGDPVRAPWARNVVWEADRFLLVALEFANRMQVTVSRNAGQGRSPLDALGSEGIAAIHGMSRWAHERRDGLATPMTLERFEQAMRAIRQAAVSPDAYGAQDLISDLLRHLDAVDVALAALDDLEPRLVPSSDDDLLALRGMGY